MIREKVKMGIPGIDNMLEGGLIPGRPYVVSGASGTGKTSVGMRFLLEGAAAGENVVYVAIDEPPNEVRANMRSFGWDVSPVHVFDATSDILSYDKTPVRDVSTERRVVLFSSVPSSIRRTSEKGPADITINTIQEILKQEMKVRKYSRVVIDSVTSLRRFYIRTSEEYMALQSFFRLLSDLDITTLLTVQLPDIPRPEAESHMARGEIRLHKWLDGRGLVRGVTVEKFRGSYHDHSMRPLKFSDEGLSVKLAAARRRGEARRTTREDEDEAETRLPPPPDVSGASPDPPPPDDVGGG